MFFLVRGGGAVFRWSHDRCQMRRVAPGFVVFLARVADDREHALAGYEEWAYLG